MAQAQALIDALKNVLKARGMTYAKIGKGLGLSEASVKRVFAERSFSLGDSTRCAACSASRSAISHAWSRMTRPRRCS